ncbi:polysaccharide export protein [Alteromonadaceae bacterium M269]|nr:polysaccharide export protein [Alteromonadaceae bacterium M269]
MLRSFVRYIALLVVSTMFFIGEAYAQTPSRQQIEQFKNLPRAQQEALARQLGINIDDFRSSASDNNEQQAPLETIVEREVNESEISEELSKQSVVEDRSSELKPFGYDLFSTRESQTDQVGAELSNRQTTPFAVPANTPVSPDYPIGPGDSVIVQLFGKESAEFELFVDNEGSIQIPRLGPMQAVGLTYQELKSKLVEKYSQQVIGVTPHITMGTLRTIQVYIVGEAYQPGAYTLSSLSSITHALFASGGINNIGSLRNIQLKRAGKTITTFDLYDLLIFGTTENDLRLQQGDVIFIPVVEKLVSVAGSVRRPAIYELKHDESLEDLVSIVGGALPTANMSKLQVARSTQSGRQIKTVDFTRSEGRAFSLSNGDYINVQESNDEFSNSILISGAYVAPGLIEWHSQLTLSSLIDRTSLLSVTDLDYALILRKGKYEVRSEVIQFEPAKVLSGEFDIDLQPFDKLTLFNRFGANDTNGVEVEVADGSIERAEDDLKGEEGDYLQEIELASFSDKQLLLKESQTFSRKKLLAPIIALLKSEGNEESPIKLAEITGQVKYPGVYPIAENGKLRDLLLASGGLTESAYLNKAELSRTSIDAVGSVVVRHYNINLIDTMLDAPEANKVLKSKDTLNISRAPGWYDTRSVELVGEVVFPGTYQIKKNETLSQLIKRAGGFTQEASARAAIFTREELREREKLNIERTVEAIREQIIASNVTGDQNTKVIDYDEANKVLDDLLAVEPIGRLVIDLEAIRDGNVNEDIILKDKDKLYIPSVSPSISVIGEVFVPTTHIMNSKLTLTDYLNSSGGSTKKADNKNIYIVKANGSVVIPKRNRAFWFGGKGNTYNLEPGDTIVVPRKVVDYQKIGAWRTAAEIIYNSIIALVAISNV